MRNLLIWPLILFLLAPAAAELPYAKHGWTKKEAATHLLNRFSYGARPGEVEKLSSGNLESWFERQLQATQSEGVLRNKLRALPPAYSMDSRTLRKTYRSPGQLKRMAKKEGIEISRKPEHRQAARDFMKKHGLRPYQELGYTLFAQRLLHARHSENSLKEVLTEFWFNHFNVAISNNRARSHVLSYERDAIRPNALGKFRELLGSTAKHPAMLLYLDNANSSAGKDAMTTSEMNMDEVGMNPARRERIKKRVAKRKKGLNENYARELLELHTLGVDGGYTQKDVVEVARAFTGWTIQRLRKRQQGQNLQRTRQEEMMGIERDGNFLFAAPIHDAGAKVILGHHFPAGGGKNEGERILDILTAHPSTAQHIAEKLAVRFISDQPSKADVQRIAKAFQRSRGDIKEVMRAVAHSPGFWSKKNKASKVKSPFELVVSANRALAGDLSPSPQLYGWMAKMGQPLYNYQAPTGFPDKAEFWVSSATVLNRVNFCLYAARGAVPGFTYDPSNYSGSVTSTMKRLLPTQDDKSTQKKVEDLLAESSVKRLEAANKFEVRPNLGRLRGRKSKRLRVTEAQKESATIIGLVLGTPGFQRR